MKKGCLRGKAGLPLIEITMIQVSKDICLLRL